MTRRIVIIEAQSLSEGVNRKDVLESHKRCCSNGQDVSVGMPPPFEAIHPFGASQMV